MTQLDLRGRPGGEISCIEYSQEILFNLIAVYLSEKPSVVFIASPRRKNRLSNKMPGTKAKFLPCATIHVDPRYTIKNPVAGMAAGKITVAVLSWSEAQVEHRKFMIPCMNNFLAQRLCLQINDVAPNGARELRLAVFTAHNCGKSGGATDEVVRRVVADEVGDDSTVLFIRVQTVPHVGCRRLDKRRLSPGPVKHHDKVPLLRRPGQAVGEAAQPQQHAEG